MIDTAENAPENATPPAAESDAPRPEPVPTPESEPDVDDEFADDEIEELLDEEPEPDADEAADDAEPQPESVEPVTTIFIWVRPGSASVGVQDPGVDPHFKSLATDDLDNIAAAIPGIVHDARRKWAEQPRQPSHTPAPGALIKPAAPPKRNSPAADAPKLF